MKIDVSLMNDACIRTMPMEACGVVLHNGRVLEVRNVAERPGIFIMDAAELVAIYEEHGDIDGVWHSHPEGDPTPSKADMEAHPPGKMMFIATPTGVTYHGRPGSQAINLVPASAGDVGEGSALHA